MTSRLPSMLPILALVLAATACDLFAEASVSPSDSTTPMPTPAATPTPAAAESAGAEPSESLPEFGCDASVHEPATTGRANIVDVRAAAHETYDRVVFEFRDGTPEVFVEPAEPPFFEDASGRPLEVRGDSFLRLTMRGGTKQQEDGTSSYDGPTNFDVDSEQLIHLIEGGDFEAQSTWYLGLRDEPCYRAFLLDDPHRLVIDVEHGP